MIPVTRPVLGEEEEAAVCEVLRSGWVTQGPRVADFEEAFRATVGASHAVAVSSCTSALHLSLVALGIGPGDEVICPSLSFIATANAIVHAGARPVFADVDEETYNLDPDAVGRVITPRTRALMIVHQVGAPADLDRLMSIADEHSLAVVEDAACALGSRYRGEAIGRPRGAVACFSFHPRKVITTGEGGMITTSDDALAGRVRRLRQHGMSASDLDRHRGGGRYRRESYPEVGYNFRMTDLQAAIGIAQLDRVAELVSRRRQLAARYDDAFGRLEAVTPPVVLDECEANYQTYLLRLNGGGEERRDAVINRLLDAGVSSRPGIMAAHLEEPYRNSGHALPVTELVSAETLVLPLFPGMTDAEQEQVIEAVTGAVTSP